MISRRVFVGACVAAGAPAATAVSLPLPGGYSFSFEWLEQGQSAAAHARLDLGRLSANPAAIRERRMLIQRRVTLRIDGPGTAARVTVALADEPTGFTMRIDGLLLSTLPRVLDPAHRLRTSVTHRIDIEIPAQAAPGSFLGRIQWLAEPA